jgi:hypothetical protein
MVLDPGSVIKKSVAGVGFTPVTESVQFEPGIGLTGEILGGFPDIIGYLSHRRAGPTVSGSAEVECGELSISFGHGCYGLAEVVERR